MGFFDKQLKQRQPDESDDWIPEYLRYDSEGNMLVESGPHTSKGTHVYHVCLDHNPYIGQSIHRYRIPHLKEMVREARREKQKLVSGSKPWGVQRTGVGLLWKPAALDAITFRFSDRLKALVKANRDRCFGKPVGRFGEELVQEYLTERGWDWEWVEDVTRQRRDGIDCIAKKMIKGRLVTHKIQVKARGADQSADTLYVQTHESNPDDVW